MESRPGHYSAPDSYRNLDEATPPPLHDVDQELADLSPHTSSRLSRAASARDSRNVRRQSQVSYDVPDSYTNLDEVTSPSPLQNPDEQSIHRYVSLEQVRTRELEYTRDEERQRPAPQPPETQPEKGPDKTSVSRLATEIYTVSYLVLFSMLGTLARLGLQALTTYPGMPITFPSIWPNFAGSLIMGFLAEDRMLFRLVTPPSTPLPSPDRSDPEEDSEESRTAAAKKAHAALKKTIPLYIGMATGFCGSLTSFSSFMRDLFLALSNDLSPPSAPRNGGYSLASLLAVLITTISLSLSGLFIGAHLAVSLEPLVPSIPFRLARRILEPLSVILALLAWLAILFLTIFPPSDTSRGIATFPLLLAPPGCLLRFYLSLKLNGRMASFPLGTFVVNILGTAVLGMAFDLQHVPPLGGTVGCQVLQGVQDGFCGCLTTVSTWVAELAALRRRNAWVYGGVSVGVGLGVLVAIMGSVRWGRGEFAEVLCVHSF
ncbi:CrcB-like protein-domain-containing protein [Echria macrotheca]|uniref:CrcB-like protein-domain-containing protein n=1 Tax=Echria macrotheca TaxID=438768 RepID=A0AAJ0F863_9PEZI|nr:CrcB-like protein-domain-containing protein [Echria macrotheca]